jgi:ubiquinone biosynthesis monooxygenase Coq7
MYNNKIKSIIRVDHAGEYGAVRIYEGQTDGFLKKNMIQIIPEIQHMKEQEVKHLEYFNKKLIETNTLSTTFLPIWHVLGYSLGYVSARLGDDFAMTCTESVEEVIDKHYSKQLDYLDSSGNPDQELRKKIHQFRQEEIEHKDHAINYNTKLYEKPIRKKLNKIFGFGIRVACKIAIEISKKI